MANLQGRAGRRNSRLHWPIPLWRRRRTELPPTLGECRTPALLHDQSASASYPLSLPVGGAPGIPQAVNVKVTIMHETIRIIRDILFRLFLISLIMGYWDRLIVDRLGLIDEKSLNVVVMEFFVLIRFYLVFILLAPALALHWTLKRLKH